MDQSRIAAGIDGALIDALLAALEALERGDVDWFPAVAATVSIDVGSDAPDMKSRQHAAFRAALKERLAELVEFGLSEAFIVRSVRNVVTRFYRELGDGHGRANQNRQATRRTFETLLGDPHALERYMQDNADATHVRGRSPDRLREEIRGFLDGPLFKEIGAEEAARDWRAAQVWDRCIEECRLSDEEIKQWKDERLARLYRRSRPS